MSKAKTENHFHFTDIFPFIKLKLLSNVWVAWLHVLREPPPERFVKVGQNVAVVAVTAGCDSLKAGVGHGLVVVPHPGAHVVSEDVSDVVSRGGGSTVVTDHTL